MEVDPAQLDEDTATQLVKHLLSELDAARASVEDAQRRAVYFRKMIGAVAELFPAVEDQLPGNLDDDDEPRPRGADAVRRVLEEHAGRSFSVPEIVELLEERGWLPDSSNPANAVRTAAERLYGQEIIEKASSNTGGVTYNYPAPAWKPGEEPF